MPAGNLIVHSLTSPLLQLHLLLPCQHDLICTPKGAQQRSESFHAVFEIAEADGGKVNDPQKLHYIQNMLDVHKAEEDIPSRPGRLLPTLQLGCIHLSNFVAKIQATV